MPTIDDVDQTADELEALLQRHYIAIAPMSRLENTLLFARKILDVRKGEELPDDADDRLHWRELCGVFALARQVIRAEQRMPDKFAWLRPLLELFGSETGQLAQTAPTTRGSGQELGAEHSDKMFELLVALCLLPEVDWLQLDRGRGDNPDILYRWHQSPDVLAIACKRMYSREPTRFRDTVIKAIDQIERSVALTGTIFVSLTNLIDHDAFYPFDGENYIGFSKARLIEMLDAEQDRLSATTAASDSELAAAFDDKKAARGIVHYLGTTYLTGSEEAPVAKAVQRAWTRGVVDPALLDAFQRGLNSTSSSPGDVA